MREGVQQGHLALQSAQRALALLPSIPPITFYCSSCVSIKVIQLGYFYSELLTSGTSTFPPLGIEFKDEWGE